MLKSIDYKSGGKAVFPEAGPAAPRGNLTGPDCEVSSGFIMIDRFHRDINYLRISVTDRCNLRCRYCMPKEGVSLTGHEDILTYEEILRVVRLAVSMGIAKVRVTGGEPLVRLGIVDFIKELKRIDGLQDISITTNGILLETFAEPLYRAGLKRINVSLDSLDPEKYKYITRGGDLARVLRGIEKAEAVGFDPIKINVVAIRHFNEDEVVRFSDMTVDKPYHVRFIELMNIGNGGEKNSLAYLSNDTVLEEIRRVHALVPLNGKRASTDGPARCFRVSGGKGELGFISATSHQFCDSCNRLRLTAEGHLRACLLSDREIDLKDALRGECDDEDIRALLQRAVLEKPRGSFEPACPRNRKKCERHMSSIGG